MLRAGFKGVKKFARKLKIAGKKFTRSNPKQPKYHTDEEGQKIRHEKHKHDRKYRRAS